VLIWDIDLKLAKSLPRNCRTTGDPIEANKAKFLQTLAWPIFMHLAAASLPLMAEAGFRSFCIDRKSRWGVNKKIDYVIRRFNASSTKVKEPKGAGPSLEHRLARSKQEGRS
jgi:hypothetical protein